MKKVVKNSAHNYSNPGSCLSYQYLDFLQLVHCVGFYSYQQQETMIYCEKEDFLE